MNQLIETFNLEEKKEIITTSKPLEIKNTGLDDLLDKSLIDDFKKARNNIDNVIELSKTALEKALEFGEMAQDHKWYEAIASLIGNINDTNRQYMENLLSISKTRKNNAESGVGKKPENNVIIDKAVFVGTTSELMKLVKPRETIDVNKSN